MAVECYCDLDVWKESHSTRELIFHASIALRSLATFEPQLHVSCELRYLTPESSTDLFELADVLGKQLRNLIFSLRCRIDQR